MEGRASMAMKVFDKIAVSCSEFTKFLRAIVTVLVEHGKTEDASKFMSRFHAGSLDDEDFLVSDYLVKAAAPGAESSLVIQKGLDLYNKNIKDYNCLKLLVGAMESQGLADKAAQYTQELESLQGGKTPEAKAA